MAAFSYRVRLWRAMVAQGATARTRLAWILAEAVADDLLDIECAKELVQRIGDEITRSNDYYYNCGYTNGCKNAEEVFND